MHGKVGSVRFESFCVAVRFLSFEPLQLVSLNFIFFTFCRYRCFHPPADALM
jgi:hypothetical protein